MQVKKGEIFNAIQVASLPKNVFDLTHQHATTMNFADLVPICCMEAVPGDSWNIGSETFIRFQPLITPMMHRCDFTVHYFFVPNRILWDGWEDFITGNQAVTAGLNVPAAPYLPVSQFTAYASSGSLFNYMGGEKDGPSYLASNGKGSTPINLLPFAAYQKIYWDYYVPKELLSNPTMDFVKLQDGDNSMNTFDYRQIKKKGWIRDYFTSALPYAQKGAAVDIPLGDIVLKDDWETHGIPNFQSPIGYPSSGTIEVGDIPPSTTTGILNSDFPGNYQAYDPNGTLTAQATTINDLRRAMRLQEWLEKNARAGTRYSESLRVHFNVISSDARLQRAEYITGIKAPIIVSEVLNTTGTEELPQGNMAGHAIGIGDSYDDTYFCEEHGWIIGLLSVTPRPAYTTGLPRFMVKRQDMLDYYWYDFANIGEQEICEVEIMTSNGNDPYSTFGYIPRYSEYKFKNDMITGDFADGVQPGSLRTWVMQRVFGDAKDSGPAVLNANFITNDIQAVASAPFAIEESPIMVQHINKLKAARLMPVYGTPTF